MNSLVKKNLDLKSSHFTIEQIDSYNDTRGKEGKKINKSTLWHQKKMLNKGKATKVYDKVKVKIE